MRHKVAYPGDAPSCGPHGLLDLILLCLSSASYFLTTAPSHSFIRILLSSLPCSAQAALRCSLAAAAQAAARCAAAMPPAAATPRRRLSAHDYRLDLRQQPVRCRATGSSDRALADRKAVDPPPIVQLVVRDGDPAREWLQSPFFFMCANLCDPVRDQPVPRPPSETLAGTLVSSLHRVRDEDDREGGYFVFGDISVKLEGRFRLQFSLFEMLECVLSLFFFFFSLLLVVLNNYIAFLL